MTKQIKARAVFGEIAYADNAVTEDPALNHMVISIEGLEPVIDPDTARWNGEFILHGVKPQDPSAYIDFEALREAFEKMDPMMQDDAHKAVVRAVQAHLLARVLAERIKLV
jgi:hypothetical protein